MTKILKSELNHNIKITEGNNKLKSNENSSFLVYSLPARSTCPYATTTCKKICYARDAQEIFKHVRNARQNNFIESQKQTFVKDVIKIIKYHLQRKKYLNKKLYFRIHESGDFYNQEYFDKWIKITDYFKNNNKISFQAYTKSLPFLRRYDIENINIKLMYSVLNDTKQEDINEARNNNLSLFIAKPLPEVNKSNFICCGDCSKCKACYETNNLKEIYIVYHGARIPRDQKVKKESRSYFK